MPARFAQIHYLTAYPANNLNRDDLGRPKTLVFGNTPRLRLSSQSVKRAWRISAVVRAALATMGEGVRSRAQWRIIGQELVAQGHPEADVVQHLLPLRDAFVGKKANPKDTELADGNDLAAVATEEAAGAAALAEEAAAASVPAKGKAKGKGKAGKKDEVPEPVLATLDSDLFFFNAADVAFIRAAVAESLDKNGPTQGAPYEVKALEARVKALPLSGDVALFGRMVAGQNALSVEGAAQVAHPFTVNKSVVDDDFFVAVDDLVAGAGTAHLGANAFGSGLYYGYVNIDLALLVRNLGGDTAKARVLVNALIEAIATVAPSGKQNTFAAHSYATFMLAETGNAQPRSFADAFLTAVKGDNLAPTAVAQLVSTRASLDKAFPAQAFASAVMDRISPPGGEGSLAEIQAHVSAAFAA